MCNLEQLDLKVNCGLDGLSATHQFYWAHLMKERKILETCTSYVAYACNNAAPVLLGPLSNMPTPHA